MGCSISIPIRKNISGALNVFTEKKREDQPAKQASLYSQICSDTCGATTCGSASTIDRMICSQVRSNIHKYRIFNEHEIDASHFSLADAPTIGVGGFGLVRLACKITSAGPEEDYLNVFAIKSIAKKSVLDRSSGPTAVFNELACLKLLSGAKSPFIANICYAFQNDKYLFLAMLYCPGGDMRYNLKLQPGHRFTEAIARFYIAQCFLAIDVCHQAFILHRDFKPENLLLDAMGYLKLTDFGVSKFFDTYDMQCKSTSGTHGYMAPEIYAKHHIHGKEVDYFAIGVTLHEFCLGQRPYEVSSLRKVHTILAKAKPRELAVVECDSGYGFFEFHNDSKSSQDLNEEEALRNAGLSLDLLHSAPFLSCQCKDFVSSLLLFKPASRLGSKGLASVQVHPWFQGFDWHALEAQTIPAPVLHDSSRLRYDARDFSANSIREHFNASPVDVEENLVFEDYHFGNELDQATSNAKK